ncbi:MAG TPA: 1,4-alpha-glucan branching protein domain-containing protein [Gemmatimonadales bacterium]|nr:1,4-alpha-glucan branching protein domain-containing protein [Gemmatimonadales bacterium]
MDFVLALHSHLPYVLNHGRWPHGSDWLCEAAIDTYLPLLETLRELAAEGTPSPVTIGFTPILANQLVSPTFATELEAYFQQRITACREAADAIRGTNDEPLIPLTRFWHERLERLRALFRSVDGDLVAPFRALEDAGRIEIMGGAATHGFSPLLGRDESIRLQFLLGQAEHQRLFGRAPAGCWLPECAYRGRGVWKPLPDAPWSGERPGTDEFVAEAGFRYFFADAHMASAGIPLSAYGEDLPMGAERFDLHGHPQRRTPFAGIVTNSPYQTYRVSSRRKRSVAAFVRDPVASAQVWSRHSGYPGDGTYLEFHKIRWPGGLKLWRVTGNGIDLGDKQPYDPRAAQERAAGHARHFAHLLYTIAMRTEDGHRGPGKVVTSPFDTELFGHWWFEGPDFLREVYRALSYGSDVRPTSAGEHLRKHPPDAALQLAMGSWGANGDYSMWLNDETVWTWRRLWPLEEAFWNAAPAALKSEAARPVLAQAARALLLAQASDWQFIISTGEVADYATRRFNGHCDDLQRLLGALGKGGNLEAGRALADELRARDDVFPDILPTLKRVVAKS